MKVLLALILPAILVGTNAFASSVCIVGFINNTYIGDWNGSEISTDCSGANDSDLVKYPSADQVTTAQIALAINKLVGKGYVLTTQANEIWTLVKK